jgi:hypothetical protein
LRAILIGRSDDEGSAPFALVNWQFLAGFFSGVFRVQYSFGAHRWLDKPVTSFKRSSLAEDTK